MFKWFLPQEVSFFDYFEEHVVLIEQAAESLLALLLNSNQIFINGQLIKQLEHEADRKTHRCIEALRKTFITPFERNDIFELISRMDDIIDYIEETVARIIIYKLFQMTQEIKQLAEILLQAVQKLKVAIYELRYLDNLDRLKQIFVEIHELENQADISLREAIARLFAEEQDVRILIKWKEVYENLEQAIDSCEDVSNVIEGVILEYG